MSLTDYSQLEGRIKDAPEPIVLRKGSEVKARIINVRIGTDKNELAYFMPVYDVPDEPLAKEFSDFFYNLSELDNLPEKQQLSSLRKFKVFAEAFGLDYSQPFDLIDDLVGLEGWLIVGVQKTDEYGEQNTVQKYVSGK